MVKQYSYSSQAGNEIPITLYGAESFGSHPCVIYIHGFKGFKDWGFVPFAAEYFAANNISFIAFNFSHNGIGADMENFTEKDKFLQNSLSLELDEALEIIHLCAHTDFFGKYLNQPIGLLGHSRGGGIAVLAAERAREIKAISTWAAVSTFERYNKQEIQEWKSKGYKEVVNSRTGQVLRMGQEMLKDVEKHVKKKLHVLNAVKRMEKPILILHGQSDETVPYFEAEHLNIYSSPEFSTMRLIPATGHTFGAKHPFEGSTPALDVALEQSLIFFKEKLVQ
ncbi:MAG: alpha/beta hydrolase [Bacteroidia bacterium]|nr:alpha/beta hydrolase [Bacteroidia bacterium]